MFCSVKRRGKSSSLQQQKIRHLRRKRAGDDDEMPSDGDVADKPKRTEGGSDDEEDRVVIKSSSGSRKRKKHSRRSNHLPSRPAVSFAMGDANAEDNEGDAVDDESTSKSRKKKKSKQKKRSGMGFGGKSVMMINEDGHEAIGNEDELGNHDGSSYSKQEIIKLVSEQRSRPAPEIKLTEDENGPGATFPMSEDGDGSNGVTATATDGDNDNKSNNKTMESTIPTQRDAFRSNSSRDSATIEIDPSSKWESSIAARAGIGKGRMKANASLKHDVVSLQDLRDQIASLNDMLEHKQGQLRSALSKRETELVVTCGEKQKHAESKQSAYEMHAFYKNIRINFISVAGALRDINQRLKPIELALCKMFHRSTSPIQQWQEDAVLILLKHNKLRQTLGRQAPSSSSPSSTAAAVDEFGRDVKSQQSFRQEQRHKQRLQMILSAKNGSGKTDNASHVLVDAFLSSNGSSSSSDNDNGNANDDDDDGPSRTERYEALQQALMLTLDEVQEDYLSKTHIMKLFHGWTTQQHPQQRQEYVESYAPLSMAEFLSVLVRVDFIQSRTMEQVIMGHEGDDGNSSKDMASLLQSLRDEMKRYRLDDPGEERDGSSFGSICEKSIVPFLMEIVSSMPPEHYFVNRQRSKHLSTMVRTVLSSSTPSSNSSSGKQKSQGIERLMDKIRSSIRSFISRISIPILTSNESSVDGIDGASTQLDLAVWYTTRFQQQYLEEVLVNLFQFWAPIFFADGDDDNNDDDTTTIVQQILELASHYLQLLSDPRHKANAKESFTSIWNALNEHCPCILASPSMMLHAAPMRAGALAYGVVVAPSSNKNKN